MESFEFNGIKMLGTGERESRSKIATRKQEKSYLVASVVETSDDLKILNPICKLRPFFRQGETSAAG